MNRMESKRWAVLKTVIIFLSLLAGAACSLQVEKDRNFYMQREVASPGKQEISDAISYSSGTYLLNPEKLKTLFDDKTIVRIEIYAVDKTKSVRTIDVVNNITRKIQLFPGNTAIIVSNGTTELGFMNTIQEENLHIQIDQFTTLAARIFRDLILRTRDDPAKSPLADILPVEFYSQVKEIRSLANIKYEQYLAHILEEGLPPNVFDFFRIKLKAPSCFYLLQMEWDMVDADDFIRYEVYRYDSAEFQSSSLLAVISDVTENDYREIFYANRCYYYYVKVITTREELATNPLAVARYPSGLVFRLVKYKDLTKSYREDPNPLRKPPEYFLKIDVDGDDPEALPLDTRICGGLRIKDFIGNEETGITAWRETDPARGYLLLSPGVMEKIDRIINAAHEEFDKNFGIRKGYRGPLSATEEDWPYCYGDNIDLAVEEEEQWLSIAEWAEAEGVSSIGSFYHSFSRREPGSRSIHLDWCYLPNLRPGVYAYNPLRFYDNYTLEAVVNQENRKMYVVKEGGRIVEMIPRDRYDLKVDMDSPVPYFRIEPHVRDNNPSHYQIDEESHRFRCAHCGEYITEAHTWRWKPEIDPEAPPEEQQPDSKSPFFNENIHWENECVYCGYRKGVAPHELDTDAGWKQDLDTHWQTCKDCQVKLNRSHHSFNQWQPVEDSRVHLRTCSVCGEVQVRPHSRVTNWQPIAVEPELGHAKYCSECGMVVEPQGDTPYLPHEPAAEISFNSSFHWQYCTICRYHCHQEVHEFGPWVDLLNGEHSRKCSGCDYTVIAPHVFNTDWVALPGDEDAGHVRYCLLCGGKDPYNTSCYAHTPSALWEFDSQSHWKVCTCCGHKCELDDHLTGGWEKDGASHWKECQICGTRIDYGEHDFGQWVSNAQHGNHQAVCRDCGYIIEEDHQWSEFEPYFLSPGIGHLRHCTVCNLLYVPEGGSNPVLPHNPADEWRYDSEGHWRFCADCGYEYPSHDHEFSEWEDFGAGTEIRHCVHCDYCEERETE